MVKEYFFKINNDLVVMYNYLTASSYLYILITLSIVPMMNSIIYEFLWSRIDCD